MKRMMSFLLAVALFAGLVLTGAPTVFAASEMTVSDALVEILKQEEGFSAKPYYDYGQYTVGYGTRCPDDMLEEYKEKGISEEDAELLLRNYLSRTENSVNKFIDKYNLTMTQSQFDALTTFTYNLGTGWMTETSGTFHNAIKSGKTGSALINAFTLWCSAGGKILPGLVRRRLSEANMYLNGEYSRSKPDHYCYVYYNANGGSVSYKIQGYDATEGVAPAYTPTYEDHTFLGWYTSQTGGTKITKLTKSISGDTLYARWSDAEGNTDTTVPAAGVTVKVTATDVNMRKGPGTNYTIVGLANKGDQLTITETASGSGYEWGNADGKWIALKFTNYAEVMKEQEKEPEATEPTVPETTVPETTVPEPTVPETTVPEPTVPETTVPEPTVPETTVPEPTVPETTAPEETKPESANVTGKVKANGGLALREGPGTGYKALKYLDNGASVTIQEQKTVGSMTWGKVDGGWVSMKYVVLDTTETKPTEPETTKPVEPEPTVPETTKPAEPEVTEPETNKLTGKVKANGGLAVRNGTGTSYSVKRYLNNGDKVTITDVIEVNGIKWGNIGDGWVSMSYITLDNKNAQITTVKTIKADCLRVRQSASTSAKIVGYYYQGEKVTILEKKKVDETIWGKTSLGWISMDYVK